MKMRCTTLAVDGGRCSWRIQKEPHRGWMKQYQQKENIIQIVPNRNVCVCVYVGVCPVWSSIGLTAYEGCQMGDPSVWLAAGRAYFLLGRIDLSWTQRWHPPLSKMCVCVSVDKCAWRGLQCNTIYAIYRLFYFHPSMFLLQYIDRQNENEAMMQLQKKNTVKKAQTALNLILLWCTKSQHI